MMPARAASPVSFGAISATASPPPSRPQPSVILEREALKWFKPAEGQFQIFYKSGADHLEYQPGFIAETDGLIYMLEPKARTEMAAPEVIAKKDVAARWCEQATAHARTCSGKPWRYVLIPHDAVAENVTIEWLARRFEAP